MIEWKPFSPKAKDFLKTSNFRLNILEGSVRSSKTINCTVRWVDYLITGPKGDLFMLGRTFATLQRNVLNDLFDIVGPENYHWKNKQQGELEILGRRVYCFGANNEDAEAKVRGATIAGAYCDEVTLYPQSVFNQLMARMSIPGAKCFCNTNPDNPHHWFYTDYITNDNIEDKKVWKFTMDDNLSLDPDYVKSLKQMYTGVWYDRMILGKWVAAEGIIYSDFNEEVHMVDMTEFLKSKNLKGSRRIIGCDYATSSVMTWSDFLVLTDGTYCKVREYYYDASSKDCFGVPNIQKSDYEFGYEFVEWIKEIPQVPSAIYLDPSASSWEAELRRRGFMTRHANNDVLNGIRTVSSKFKTNQFFMDKSCVNSKIEYQSYVWDTKRAEMGEDKPVKKHDHTCDADRYVIYTDSLYGRSGVY